MMTTPTTTPAPSSLKRKLLYFGIVLLVAGATVGVMLLLQNIMERKAEDKQKVFKIVELTEHTGDPAEWGKNFPRQYDTYKRTVDIERTRYGGSESFTKLSDNWRLLFKDYAFEVEYNEERGHAYMLHDQEMSRRVKERPQFGACLHCHSSVLPAYREEGRKAGIPDEKRQEQVMKGFEIVCKMPYLEARNLKDAKGQPLIKHPVACIDCHHPESMELRITRPAFLNGLRDLAQKKPPEPKKGEKAVAEEFPHLPSIGRLHRENKEREKKGLQPLEYDVNTMASRQERRSLVCAQCHVEYYFKKDSKLLVYPWQRGLKVEEIESYYDDKAVNHTDWPHPVSGANLLKAQHPEFELWSQGIHARSGVACADCHMPYVREGAIKISDHHVRSPLLNVARACQTCHRYPEEEIKARAEAIQQRTRTLLTRAENAVMDLIRELERAKKAGASDDQLKKARDLHRQAQWRLDFVAAENSMGFHAPQEAARILAEAIDFGRQGQVEAAKIAR